MAKAGFWRGTRRWILPAPRLPSKPIREAGAGFRLLRSMGSLLLVHRWTCPQCGKASLERREAGAALQAGDGPVTGHPVLVCAAGCGYFRILDDEITSPEALVRGQRLFSSAALTFVVALAVMASTIALGLYLWSWVTLLGGVVIGTFIALQAAVLRYRAWQLSYGRLFEARAPVAEWIRWEFDPESAKVGVPGTETALRPAALRDQ